MGLGRFLAAVAAGAVAVVAAPVVLPAAAAVGAAGAASGADTSYKKALATATIILSRELRLMLRR